MYVLTWIRDRLFWFKVHSNELRIVPNYASILFGIDKDTVKVIKVSDFMDVISPIIDLTDKTV